MKPQNHQEPEKRIFNTIQSEKDFIKSIKENPGINETDNKHYISLPDNRLIEIWYENTIAPVRLNEFQKMLSIHINKRSDCCQGNTFETKPFSEIYNWAVMHDYF